VNRINGTALVLLVLGAFLGSAIGWVAVAYYQQPMIVILIIACVVGTTGFFAGAYVRNRGIDARFEKPAKQAALILLAALAASSVLFGVTKHDTGMVYTGLIGAFAVVMMIPANPGAIIRSVAAMGICVVAVLASLFSGDRSWLIMAVASALAALSVLYIRHRQHDGL
jgi:hypothetical protein